MRTPSKSTSGDQDLAVSEPNVPTSATDLLNTEDDAARSEAQDRAQAQIAEVERRKVAEAQAAAEAEQRETEHVLTPSSGPAQSTADGESGGVKLRYLGTSDVFTIRGAAADGSDIVAVAGGDPITVSQEQADWYRTRLVHDRFEVVEDEPTTTDQENSE